jgi:hypothetical protein
MLAVLNGKFKRNIRLFTRSVDTVAHEQLRLRLLFSVAVSLFNFIGGAWDIQWRGIGRMLFIPPPCWCWRLPAALCWYWQ